MTGAVAPARTNPPILAAIRPLLIAGWSIAAIRLALDALAPDAAMWFGVYWLMPVVLLVLGRRGALAEFRWLRLALAMIVTGLLVWALPNLVSYTIAQFAGWTHGRFTPGERGPPVQDSAWMKVFASFLTAHGTAIGGSLWMIVWATLLVWLPGVRRRRAAPR